ncbi:MAG: dihydroneopterin aldolase [Labrys sp. (in: a-proteobacteria)]
MDAALSAFSTNIVFVRALRVEAHIGYYAHEKGHTQPLVIDVELDVAAEDFGSDDLARTVDYDTIADHARSLARTHVDLVETFAERLAALCLGHPLTRAVRIRIEKPQAIKDAIAGVAIMRRRS